MTRIGTEKTGEYIKYDTKTEDENLRAEGTRFGDEYAPALRLSFVVVWHLRYNVPGGPAPSIDNHDSSLVNDKR